MSDSTTTIAPVKTCSRCGVEKGLDCFTSQSNGRPRPWCRECYREYNASWRLAHPGYHVNYNSAWRSNNADRHRRYMREYQREWIRQWRADNPELARKMGRQSNERRRANPQYRVAARLSASIHNAIKSRKAGRSWESMVGYSLDDLMSHIESLFLDGMSWENMGEWEIDHLIPVSLFDLLDDDSVRLCWSLRNLRPLWYFENGSKSDTIPCVGKRVRDLSEGERQEILAVVKHALA